MEELASMWIRLPNKSDTHQKPDCTLEINTVCVPSAHEIRLNSLYQFFYNQFFEIDYKYIYIILSKTTPSIDCGSESFDKEYWF